MRNPWINFLAPALLLAVVTVVSSQQPNPGTKPEPKPAPAKDKDAPAKSQLEEMLEIALKNNPDIRVAEAKARTADAELDRTRLAITQKIVVLYQDIEVARANVKAAKQEVARVSKLLEKNFIDAQAVDEAETKLTVAKAKLAKLEAEIPYLQGQPNTERRSFPGGGGSGGSRGGQGGGGGGGDLEQQGTATVNSPMSDKIRAALDKPVTFEFTANGGQGGDNLDRFLSLVMKEKPGFIFSNKVADRPGVSSVKFEAVPLGAILQWLEDDLGTDRIVVRDYGLLLVPRDKVPADAVLLHDFWKTKPKDAPKATEEKK